MLLLKIAYNQKMNLEADILTARGLFFSVDSSEIFHFGGGTTTAPIGRRQTTVQKTKKEQKMRGI